MLDVREHSLQDMRGDVLAGWNPAEALPAWSAPREAMNRTYPRAGSLRPTVIPTLGINLSPIGALFLGLSIDAFSAVTQSFHKFQSTWSERRNRDAPPVGGLSKRILDIVVASTALLLLSPVMIMVAALIKITIGGPVIFTHRRVGLNGATFPCLKFRSMVVDGDAVLARHLENDPAAAREWSETRKLNNDPRVTPLGRILRKSSLDELPQLFNVLRGDMSCVGPRPIVPAELERYGSKLPYYLGVRPGLTGMWQVSGRSRLSYKDRVALDCLYVRRWSLWLDISLLFWTIPAVLAFEEAA